VKTKKEKCKDGWHWIEDGIIWHFIDATDHTFEMAEDSLVVEVAYCKRIKGKKLILVDLGNMLTQSHESRKCYVSHPLTKTFDRVALLLKNPVTRTIGNFFLGIDKPLIPLKLFTDEGKALKWLRK